MISSLGNICFVAIAYCYKNTGKYIFYNENNLPGVILFLPILQYCYALKQTWLKLSFTYFEIKMELRFNVWGKDDLTWIWLFFKFLFDYIDLQLFRFKYLAFKYRPRMFLWKVKPERRFVRMNFITSCFHFTALVRYVYW